MATKKVDPWDSSEGRPIHGITAKRLTAKSRVHAEAMVRHGTTTLEAKTGCGPDEAAEMKVLRVLAALDGTPMEVAATLLVRLSGEAAQAGLERIYADLMEKVQRRRMARFVDVQWSGATALRTAERLAGLAHRLSLRLSVHDQGGEPGAACRAVDWGAVSVAHMERAGEEDVAALAGSGTMATLLPACSFHERRGYAPARSLVDAGAAVALGSNFNPLLTPTLSMQSVIALAVSRLRLTPAEALSAATINAAHALRCADRRGSLEFGKAADLLILATSDYRDLAHHFGHNMVLTTIKRGTVVYQQGEVVQPPCTELEMAV